MGYYDTTQLPIYQYLHSTGHPDYVIADNFFQAAFGGSFLNHQWLVAAATPAWPSSPRLSDDLTPCDSNGMPTNYPLYHADRACRRRDQALTACVQPAADRRRPPSRAATTRSTRSSRPTSRTRRDPAGAAAADEPDHRRPAERCRRELGLVLGRLVERRRRRRRAGLDERRRARRLLPIPTPFPKRRDVYPHCPNKLFQFHHQPLNYFATSRRAPRARTHLRDEVEFLQLAARSRRCQLNSVSFIKPIGAENEHPGYTSEPTGSDHLVDLINAIVDGAARRTR